MSNINYHNYIYQYKDLGSKLWRRAINTMYHVVKQYQKIGHKLQWNATSLAVVAQSVIYIKYIFHLAKLDVE